jgi:ketosteroid isomerase-like protein
VLALGHHRREQAAREARQLHERSAADVLEDAHARRSVSSRAMSTADRDALFATEQAIMAAIRARDVTALAALVTDDFVLRMPGQPDADKQAFLAGIGAIPGEIVGVEGAELDVRVVGDVGVISGLQIARVRVEGQEIEDRGVFVDLFVRRNGRWIMQFAYSSPAPAPAAAS